MFPPRSDSTNDVPIIAERAMYFSRPGQDFAGGHDSAGVTQPSQPLVLRRRRDRQLLRHVPAAGESRPGADGARHGVVPADRRHGHSGASRPRAQQPRRPTTSRSRIRGSPARRCPRWSTSTVPIVAERSMYWPKRLDRGAQLARCDRDRHALGGGGRRGRWHVRRADLRADRQHLGVRRHRARHGAAGDGAPLTKDIPLPPSSRTNVPIGAIDGVRRRGRQPLRRD